MDLREMQDALGIVGRSGTAEFRQVLKISDAMAARQLIGQFGIGFLSAFMVADRVVIISKRWGRDTRTVLFSSSGTSTYELRERDDDRPHGTTIILHLKTDARTLLDVSTVRRLVTRYCNFVQFPIYIAGTANPINSMRAPWHGDSTEDEYWSFVHSFYAEDALAVFPVKSPLVSGVLFIPSLGPRSYARGNVALYLRRLYVHDSDQYLPESLRFLRGCLECSDLTLTASRSDIVRDTHLEELRKELANFAYECLRKFVKKTSEQSIAFLTQYDGLLKAEALRDGRLFEAIYEQLLLPCVGKSLTISDCMASITAKWPDKKPCVFYYAESEPDRREFIERSIAYSDIPVLNASLPINRLFIESLAKPPLSIDCYRLSYEIVSLLVEQRDEVDVRPEEKTRAKPTEPPPPSEPTSLVATTSLDRSLFVMMPFAEDLRWVFGEVIVPVGEELGLQVSRMDEESFVGRITEKIEQRIANSSILLADVTDNNPNVMYELGLAHGMLRKSRTILIAQDLSKIPFDIKDYVVIEYGTARAAVSFRRRLLNAIKSVLSEAEST
jgi:hypothetical protein